ncbi:hypothetical protein F9U64_14055 [Gracilibacillus oryzae]|uniref:Uncharacterized protein n=2 Tax=Gracilibacillus oryzae TaxID=1672701 RepID=A0A7C8KXG3_9BACI|nr:hypothetical protein F9U64_14055 [Gracilibacillus oryzae]
MVVAIIFVGISVFQILLACGYPLGEFALGGYYKVLPVKLRVVSGVNALVLLIFAVVLLLHSNIISGIDLISVKILIWGITVFLGINTIANLISRSKKERYVMTPLSFLTFVLCLYLSIAS